ncbi:helix-turn-helix transcriptional regulator [Sinorhizobium fredii]|uniref:helix-turn-helix domain-containing protein n=1 Tax=Rhizobium fredii TaxID=380 RepID=UPI0030A3C55A
MSRLNSSNTAEMDIRIGSRIRHFRTARGLSQTALAEKAGVTFQQLQKYEKGTNRIATSRLVLICKALEISPADVLDQFFDERPAVIATAAVFVAGAALDNGPSEIQRIAA